MKDYIIYSRIYTEDGKVFLVYAACSDDSVAKFVKKEEANEGYYKLVKFPTMNSAIIWWRRHMELIRNEYGFYSSILKYNPNPIIDIGEVINGDVSKLVAVHRLSLNDYSLNEPDKKTWTDEEKNEYEMWMKTETLVRDAIESITSPKRRK